MEAAAAAAADMLLNYPLWILAKRISANLPPPRTIQTLYKGSTHLYLSTGPTTVVEESVTRRLGGGAGPAMASGLAAAGCVGAQTEALVTRAHATGASVPDAAREAFRARRLMLPPGLLMVAAREIPYAGCLFWLSGRARELVGGARAGGRSIATDALAAVFTAAVAGPLSHVPACVAAHQQAHALGLSASVRAIYASRGVWGFWSGLGARSASLAGSLFIVPFVLERLQPEGSTAWS